MEGVNRRDVHRSFSTMRLPASRNYSEDASPGNWISTQKPSPAGTTESSPGRSPGNQISYQNQVPSGTTEKALTDGMFTLPFRLRAYQPAEMSASPGN